MHKTPKKLKKGFKVHAESHNELVDYVKRTRPIATHGHTETNSGTMPPHPSPAFRAQFTPSFIEGSSPKLAIYPGYVFGSWRDAGDTDESHLPDVQQWVIEPKIGGSYLTAEEQPQLALVAAQTNYIYLKLDWSAHSSQIGGMALEGSGSGASAFAFKADHWLQVTHDGDANDVADGPGAHGTSGYNGGIFVQVDRVYYTLTAATFIRQQDQQPPADTDVITYIPAGMINLNDDGQLASHSSPQADALRWFLEGPVWANRPPIYGPGITAPDRGEPIAPVQPETYVYPGAETDN